jgi:isoquinoline 1-oxidoreductase subunit beta
MPWQGLCEMGTKRRAFLIGGAAVLGGGVFAAKWADTSAASSAKAFTTGQGESSFTAWLKIGADDAITVYSPHADIGQGSDTALGQMLAEELDADWTKVSVVAAPAELGFANTGLGRGFLGEMTGYPGVMNAIPTSLLSPVARAMPLQITGGSSAMRFTGQFTMRVVGAATRIALIETAAMRLGVPRGELTTAESKVMHTQSGTTLRYGELAAEAAERALDADPKLKQRTDFKLIGKSTPRIDAPGKVTGKMQYGIDVSRPNMRVATVMAAPVRGGKLLSVDHAPAMAIKGVEKVIELDAAVVVVATGYWSAIKGLRALSPKFSDGGNAETSTDSVFAAQDALRKSDKPDSSAGHGDLDAGLAKVGTKLVESGFRVPFLHHAMMEPFALTVHHHEGKLDIWGGLQDPLATKMAAAKFSGLSPDKVTFHPMTCGGSFGRRLPKYVEIVEQVTRLAMQLPYPVKLIWSREEEVSQGAYRPQSSAQLRASVGSDGKIAAWQTDYVQPVTAEGETTFIYELPAVSRRLFKHVSNQTVGSWRSVNSTQQGFYNECFIDELAVAAGIDPLEFRRRHLLPGSRHLAVLDAVAKRSGWGTPLPRGVGRGVAIVESFKTIVAEVVEASLRDDGTPKVHRVFAVVDCGLTVNPGNAENQIQGGIVMGLSAALGEAITLDKGAVVQRNFADYSVSRMAGAPLSIDVHFVESGASMGGIGEPGLPPAAPALVNALFAATGKRVRQLPINTQAKA